MTARPQPTSTSALPPPAREEDRLAWQLAVDAAGVGAFDWDLVTGELRWDERLLELFGLCPETFGGTIEAFNDLVHPDDRARVSQALEGAVASCGVYEAEYRIVHPDGEVRWIFARGQAHPGPDGSARRLVGAAYDTTAAREGDARVTRILEAMPLAFYRLDTQWRFTYANAEALRLLSGVSSAIVGQSVWELFPAAVGSDFETSYRRAVETGEPVTFEAYYPPPLDSWYEIRAWPTPDGLSVYFVDITQRRAVAESLRTSAQRLALLAEVSASLGATFNTEQAVGRLAQLVVPRLADWCLVTLVDDPEPFAQRDWRRHFHDIGWWHVDPGQRDTLEAYSRTRIPALTDGSLLARAVRLHEPVVLESGATEAILRVLDPGPAQDVIRRLAPESLAVLPMQGRGRTVGVITVARGDRAPFSPEDVDALLEIAARAGLALDNARLYAEQRDLAEGLQRSLLTAPPALQDLEIAVRYEPAAEIAQVGGDWYDSFLQSDGTPFVVIGDVVGHDTAAAAAMGQLRGLVRGIAVTTGERPADVLRRVDVAMPTLQIDTTATCVVAQVEQIESDTGAGRARVRWSNAGHPPPLVAVPGPGGVRVRALSSEPADLLLGLDPDTSRTESSVDLPTGATLLLYSDGLVERRGQDLTQGIETLERTLAGLVADGLDLETLCDELLRLLVPDRREDDVALVAVRVRPRAEH